MRKNNFTIVGILIVSVLMMWSCNKSSDKVSHIPGEAFAVVMIDGSYIEKVANPDLIEDNEQLKEGMEELEEISDKIADLVNDIIKDPGKSGMDLEGESYAFAYIQDEDIIVGGILGINRKTLEKNIELIEDEIDFELEMEEKDGVSYTMPEDDVIIGWTKNMMLILTIVEGNDTDIEDEFFRLINLKKSESIIKDKDFNKFQSNCEDINIWISSNVINDIPDGEGVDYIGKALGIDLEDNYGHLHFGFDKEEWTMTLKLRFNESVQDADINKIIKNVTELGLLDDLFGSNDDYDWDDDDWGDDDWGDDWDDEDWGDEDWGDDEMTDEEWEEDEEDEEEDDVVE